VLSRAKGGAISPRLGNRYGRFPLSHRSCGCGVDAPAKREQRLERSQVPHPSRALCGRVGMFSPDALRVRRRHSCPQPNLESCRTQKRCHPERSEGPAFLRALRGRSLRPLRSKVFRLDTHNYPAASAGCPTLPALFAGGGTFSPDSLRVLCELFAPFADTPARLPNLESCRTQKRCRLSEAKDPLFSAPSAAVLCALCVLRFSDSIPTISRLHPPGTPTLPVWFGGRVGASLQSKRRAHRRASRSFSFFLPYKFRIPSCAG
jgi:hypothetical protein